MIWVSKKDDYVVLIPKDSLGGHQAVELMGCKEIPESKKKLDKNQWLVHESAIHELNALVKKLQPVVKVDALFSAYAKTLKKENAAVSIAHIYVGVTNSKIVGKKLPTKEMQDVTKFFLNAAVNVDSYKNGKWDGYINLFSRKTNTFPTGLLSRIETVMHKHNIPYEKTMLYDAFPKPSCGFQINWGGITPADDQIEAIESAVRNGRGIVKAPTAYGKTAVFAKGLICRLDVPTLFIANKKQLLDDAAKDFEEGVIGAKCLAIKDGRFGDVKLGPTSSDSEIASALKGANIIVATIQSLAARLRDERTRFVLQDWLEKTCKLVIVDESQAVGTTTWDEVLEQIKAPYRILLSATPRRTDGATIKLEAASGPCIFNTTAQEQIKKGRLCELDIVYNVFDHELFNESDAAIPYADAYRACIMENEKRNRQAILEPTLSMMQEGRHVLVLIQYIEHGHILRNMMIAEGIPAENIRFIWGETPNKVRESAIAEFRKGDFQVMIGSTIFDAGVNIPVISGVVLGGAGNSDITLIQRIGRGARNCDYEDVLHYLPEFMQKADGKKITKVYDVMDANIKFFGKQSRNRYRNACEEFGKDRCRIVGFHKKAPKHLSRETLDSLDIAAAQFRMMEEMMKK